MTVNALYICTNIIFIDHNVHIYRELNKSHFNIHIILLRLAEFEPVQ